MSNQDQAPLGGAAGPNPDQIEILYAGNIADDDLMWIVRCSVEQFHRLIASPVAWVTALASLPGWRYVGSDQPAPAPVLTRDFAMVVRETDTPDPDGWVTVQGISLTNEITVVASRAGGIRSLLAQKAVADAAAKTLGMSVESARAASGEELLAAEGDPFAAFWEEVARDPNNPPTLKKALPVNVVASISRFYAHFEILDRSESPEERAARTASFLLAAALDPKGYAAMLSGLDQTTLYVDRGSVSEGPAIVIAPSGHRAGVVYANLDASVQGDDAESDPGEEGEDDEDMICSVVDGPYIPPIPPLPLPPLPPPPGTGTPDDTVVKSYRTHKT